MSEAKRADAWSPARWREAIFAWGAEIGLTRVGIAPATEPPGSRRLLEWLAAGRQAGMAWMARDPEKRIDPARILPEARSVIVVSLAYRHPDPVPLNPQAPRVSCYAWGDDYHDVLGGKLRALAERIRQQRPETRLRIACDTSPVMDKAWAAHGGLGWVGKNTCLIHPRDGSWLFLGEIFVDLDLPTDAPVVDHCGTCRRCLDACPTAAFPEPYVLDASRCISYLNIEHRGEHAAGAAEALDDWLIGCDLCQDVCPWNRKAPPSAEAAFRPREGMAELPAETWAEMSDGEIRARVRGTAVTRIKPPDLRRNARAVIANRRGGGKSCENGAGTDGSGAG